jgi:hypothetical protein
VLGALILTPAKLGMDLLVFDKMAWQSLIHADVDAAWSAASPVTRKQTVSVP